MLFNIKKKYLKVSAVIHLNYPKHHYIVVAAKESLKLIALVRFQLSHPFYYTTTAEIVIPKKLLLYE